GSILVVRVRRSHPHLAVGWFWYLGMLVPVIGLVQVGHQALADRYTYLPLVGVFIIVVWGAHEILSRLRQGKIISWIFGIGLLAGCGILTRIQLSAWRNTLTLFNHNIETVGPNDTACYNLGCYYSDRHQIQPALEYFQKAVALNPKRDDAHDNLGSVLFFLGRTEEAIEQFRETLKINP